MSKTEELYQRARSSIIAIDKQLVELERQRISLVEKKLQWQGAAEACLNLGWEMPSPETESNSAQNGFGEEVGE